MKPAKAVSVTLAGILLLGKDSVIISAVPHHRTDMILRKVNLDRYDDRDLVTTNLIESYERIIAFIQKHLPDEKHFREHYQQPAVVMGLIEMTIPDKPRSSKQKYRLTDAGKRLLKSM